MPPWPGALLLFKFLRNFNLHNLQINQWWRRVRWVMSKKFSMQLFCIIISILGVWLGYKFLWPLVLRCGFSEDLKAALTGSLCDATTMTQAKISDEEKVKSNHLGHIGLLSPQTQSPLLSASAEPKRHRYRRRQSPQPLAIRYDTVD